MTARFGSVIVLAKRPVPGRVKTRLTPPLSPEQAAHLAGATLWDTLRVVGRVPAREHVLAFDGDATGWQLEGWRVAPQPPGGLGERIVAAFGAAGPGPSVLVGMDTPQLRADQLCVFDPTRFDACFGRATDGGFWALGFADPMVAAAALPGVPMSTDRTGEQQLIGLCRLGLRVQILDELTDVDTIDDARDVAALAPQSAFASALAGLRVM